MPAATAHDPVAARDVAAAFEDGHDCRRRGQFGQCLGRELDGTAVRIIVDDQRQGCCSGNRQDVLDETGLGRLVVVGQTQKDRIDSRRGGVADICDALRRRIRPGRRDDGVGRPGSSPRQPEQAHALLARQRRAFSAGGPENDAVRPFLDLPVHQPQEGWLVQRVAAERCHQWGEHAAKPVIHRKPQHIRPSIVAHRRGPSPRRQRSARAWDDLSCSGTGQARPPT